MTQDFKHIIAIPRIKDFWRWEDYHRGGLIKIPDGAIAKEYCPEADGSFIFSLNKFIKEKHSVTLLKDNSDIRYGRWQYRKNGTWIDVACYAEGSSVFTETTQFRFFSESSWRGQPGTLQLRSIDADIIFEFLVCVGLNGFECLTEGDKSYGAPGEIVFLNMDGQVAEMLYSVVARRERETGEKYNLLIFQRSTGPDTHDRYFLHEEAAKAEFRELQPGTIISRNSYIDTVYVSYHSINATVIENSGRLVIQMSESMNGDDATTIAEDLCYMNTDFSIPKTATELITIRCMLGHTHQAGFTETFAQEVMITGNAQKNT